MDMLETLVQRNNIEDQRDSKIELMKDDEISFIPTSQVLFLIKLVMNHQTVTFCNLNYYLFYSFGQFFLVIAQLINVLLRRFKDLSKNETMQSICERYKKLKDKWKHSLDNSTDLMSSSDPLSNEEGRKFFFSVLDKELDRTDGILNKQRRIIPQKTVDAPTSYYENLSLEADIARTYDPPGIASLHVHF